VKGVIRPSLVGGLFFDFRYKNLFIFALKAFILSLRHANFGNYYYPE
jgi:hypothetical protein